MRALTVFIAALASLALSACQTSRAVSFAYQDATYGGETYKRSDKTSVLFLMDGFSAEMLRTSLRTQNTPTLARTFNLNEKARFSLGRAVFPSLTFPNITSILVGATDAHHPITGNHVLIDDKVLNFESVLNWQELALMLQRRTVFYKLAQENQTSVSYSYAFSGGATAYQATSAAAAAGYLESDYASIDSQTIASLCSLLSETPTERWPRFLFVHIIGIDATAHHYGPYDERVQDYIHAIDEQLAPIFSLLDHPNGTAAPTREVNYAMTADHGFKPTPDHSPLDEVVTRMGRRLKLVADNRVAPLYIQEPMSEADRTSLATALLQVPHVAWAIVRTDAGLKIMRRSGSIDTIQIAPRRCEDGQQAARFNDETQAYRCLSDFDAATGPDDDSFIVPALVDYFSSANPPDMIFIPDDHSDFAEGYKGNHGGLSRDEMLVPVLTHGVDLDRGVHPTADLLKAMGVLP